MKSKENKKEEKIVRKRRVDGKEKIYEELEKENNKSYSNKKTISLEKKEEKEKNLNIKQTNNKKKTIEHDFPRSYSNKKEKKFTKKNNNKFLPIISRIFSILFIMSMILIYGLVISLDILPFKYIVLFTIIMSLVSFIIFYFLFNKRIKKVLKIISMFISVFFMIGSIITLHYTTETLKFFEDINNADLTTTEKYYVAVKKDSEYKDIKELENVRVATFNENTNYYKEVLDKLSKEVETTLIEYESSLDVIDNLLSGEVPAILISNLHKEQYMEEHENLDNSIRIIYSIEVETTNSETEVVTIKPASENVMTIYISGIDSYGSIKNRSRSDVNMLATINTKTHEVLLISIPRDYYVQLHGTKGYKDKLTHSGIYGVNMSIQTIQDFMGIDINYYAKVNFSTLIKVVDIIGGIEVYSDKSFVPHTDKTVYIKKGINKMNGKEALAFSRERYAYSDGDRHRVKNQQDVLAAIIKKVTTSPTLLTKYSTLLNSVSSSFQTNVDFNQITDLVKIQLETMPNWVIKQYSLDGTGSQQYTYSMGKRNLYVMIPNESTIEKGRQYVKGMTEGKTLKELGFK